MNRFLLYFVLSTSILLSNRVYSQTPEIEGMWLVCDAKDECDASVSNIYMFFEKKTMQTHVQVTGIDPKPVGEKLKYEWNEDGLLVVTKKGDIRKDIYIIEIEGNKMTMTHHLTKSKNYFEKR